jgi:GT2 family glycosyltransferase
LWTPDALQLHATAVAECGVQPIVLGESRFENLDGSFFDVVRLPRPFSANLSADRTRYLFQCHFGNLICRRSVFDEIGLLDESLRFHEDYEFFGRAERAGVAMLRHRGVVQVRRFHDQNMTLAVDEVKSTTARFLKSTLDLRRRAAK